MVGVSNSYNFNPPIGSITLSAFARCGVHRSSLTPQHMEDAFLELGYLQSDWGADGITWWTVELLSQPLTQGTPTYPVPANVVSVLDVYISNGTTNRIITNFSRTDYASLAQPLQQGFPTVVWFDRTLSPSLTLWPTPDNAATYVMWFYAYTQIQDAVPQQGGNAAIPFWWLNALVADLAHRLSRIYAPQLEDKRKIDKQEAYANAIKQTEPSPLFLTPGLQGFYRP